MRTFGFWMIVGSVPILFTDTYVAVACIGFALALVIFGGKDEERVGQISHGLLTARKKK